MGARPRQRPPWVEVTAVGAGGAGGIGVGGTYSSAHAMTASSEKAYAQREGD